MAAVMNDYTVRSEDTVLRSFSQTVTTATTLFGLLAVGAPGSAIAAQQQGSRYGGVSSPPAAVRSVTGKANKQVAMQTAPSVSASESLKQIRQSFGLNVTELAELFGVSRPTVYSWLKGGEVRREVSLKLQVLDAVALHWLQIQGGEDFSFLFDYKGPQADQDSIREALKGEELDARYLKELTDTRLDEYVEASAKSREILGDASPVKGEAIPKSTRKMNQLWTSNVRHLKNSGK